MKRDVPVLVRQPGVSSVHVAASVVRPLRAQSLQRKPAMLPPPVFRPTTIARPAPPPVYSPKSVPVAAQRKPVGGTPPVYKPAVSMPPTPPPVYSPATLPTLQRATAGINTFVYRPAFRRAAYGNAGVVQRQRDPNPQKPKYKLSKFAVEIQQLIADHFNIPRKAFRLKEHCNSDFAVSSFTQEILYEQILDPSLSFDRDAFARENPDVELEQLYQAADSINGLTTEEVSGPIIHVRQDESFKRMQCTLIHEALHAYSHNAFKARYEKDMDEGMTELLALEIMAQYKGLTDTRSVMKVYTTEKRGAEALVRNYGVAAAQNAYFNGIFSATMPLNKAGLPVA